MMFDVNTTFRIFLFAYIQGNYNSKQYNCQKMVLNECENRYKIVNVKILPEIIQDMVSINSFFAVKQNIL